MTDKDWAACEERFLERLEADPLPVDDLLRTLDALHAVGENERFALLGELLLEALAARGKTDAALATLRRLAEPRPPDAAGARQLTEQLLTLLGRSPQSRALIESCGLEDLPASWKECFDRLQVLRSLAPEQLCYDRTWGIGRVLDSDWFYRRVRIDFEKRAGHEMAFDYAGRTLEILPEDHFFARLLKETKPLRTLAHERPAEVVRLALHSLGPLTAVELQEHLSPRLVPAGDWKAFWEGARKGLKPDPLIRWPARRTEPVVLLEEAHAYDAAWRERLAGERDPETLLTEIGGFLCEHAPETLAREERALLADRLKFVWLGALHTAPGRRARAVALWAAVLPSDEAGALRDLVAPYLAAATLRAAVADMGVRDLRRFLAVFLRAAGESARRCLLDHLLSWPATVLSECLELLAEQGHAEECAQRVRALCAARQAGAALLYWIARHPEQRAAWQLGGLPWLAGEMLRTVDEDASGEVLKSQNQLRALLSDAAWMAEVMAAASPEEAEELLRSLRTGRGWSEIARRSALAGMVKARPQLERILQCEAPAARSDGDLLLTSPRSYHARRRQLERIAQEEIPAVAREIGIARAHGDLRENFEYKAAKDKQALLLRRRDELEDLLARARPETFQPRGFERVECGQAVTLEYADGRRRRFCLLGAWDSDEPLGILPSESALASALLGRAPGEDVVPEGGRGERCRLVSIEPLPAEVVAWMNT